MNLADFFNNLFTGKFSSILYAILHAHWSNLWAAISALFTAGAVIVAAWAMLRWRKQDELKVKLAFKVAVSEYLVTAITFNQINGTNSPSQEDVELHKKVTQDFAACRHCWWILEGLLDDEKDIKNAWKKLSENHNKFVMRAVSIDEIINPCSLIIAKAFVFK